MIILNDILQCPACLGRIEPNLRCHSCRTGYEEWHGIPVMVSPMVSNCRSCWERSDFATGRVESKTDIYQRFLNQETRDARALWIEAMMERIRGMEGLVADVATGLWGLAGEMLDRNPGIATVSADIDPMLLEWKKKRIKASPGREFHSVASDALHFAFADGTFDGIANADGLINMVDTELFLAEMRRTLKPGRRMVIMHRMFAPGSRSFSLARIYGIHRTLEPGPLLKLLEEAGFSDARVEEVSRAVWADNPAQAFPQAGDLQRFAIVEAVK